MYITPVQQLQSRHGSGNFPKQATLYFSSTLDKTYFGQQPPPVNKHPLMQRILGGKPVVLYHGQHDTTNAHELLEEAIKRKTSFEIDGNIVTVKGPDGKKREYFVNAHHPKSYLLGFGKFPGNGDPANLHPKRYLDRARETGLFIKFDFKSPKAIKAFGELAQNMPAEQRMVHVCYAPLDYRRLKLAPHKNAELFSPCDLQQRRQYIGENTPLLLSCKGLRQKDLTDELLADIALKTKGQAQFVNFNPKGGKNIPAQFARKAWQEYGIISEIKIKDEFDKLYWDAAQIPYLGVTDQVDLATVW